MARRHYHGVFDETVMREAFARREREELAAERAEIADEIDAEGDSYYSAGYGDDEQEWDDIDYFDFGEIEEFADDDTDSYGDDAK